MSHLRLLSAVSLAIACSSGLHAQEQGACVDNLKATIEKVFSGLTSQYSEAFRPARNCIASGKCRRPDVEVTLQEFLVDEEMVSIRRKKLRVVREFMKATEETPNSDACGVLTVVPPVVARMEGLNAQELKRLSELVESRFGPTISAQ
jgi:hypothetical protein